MSFDSSREYPRFVLQPINLPANICQGRGDDGQLRTSQSNLWTATTHSFHGTLNRVVPSCWPSNRFNDDPANIPDDPSHDKPYAIESAQNRPSGSQESIYNLYAEAPPPREGQMPPPQLVAKRYVPIERHTTKSSSARLTLLMLPGMGLPKEAFEPMIDALIARSNETGQLDIAELWTIDMPMCGESALSNPPGYLYGNEKDITRDLLLFTTAYMPLESGLELPTRLAARRPDGRVRPNLHVAGHSLGGQSAMLIAAHAPVLFASLTVFDPAMIPSGKIQQAFAQMAKDVLCMNIECQHESREALKASLRANRRTRGWDERILKLFIEHGVVPGHDGKLRLKSNPRLEWALYYDQETPSHCYDRLKDLRTPLNAIMPARPFAVPPKMLEADMSRLPQETRLTFIPKTTHQLPFEEIDKCSELLFFWLAERSSKSGTPRAKL